MKDILNIFQKGSVVGLDDWPFWGCSFEQIRCANAKCHEWLNQKWLGIHFLFLSKNDIYSVVKIPVANFFRSITPQTYPGNGMCVTSLNLNI